MIFERNFIWWITYIKEKSIKRLTLCSIVRADSIWKCNTYSKRIVSKWPTVSQEVGIASEAFGRTRLRWPGWDPAWVSVSIYFWLNQLTVICYKSCGHFNWFVSKNWFFNWNQNLKALVGGKTVDLCLYVTEKPYQVKYSPRSLVGLEITSAPFVEVECIFVLKISLGFELWT